MEIISELCQNHLGDFDLLGKMIQAASKHSDIIKIQSIKASTFTEREEYENFRPYTPEYDRLKGLELSHEDELFFVRKCKEYNVKSMTTIFSPTHYDYFNSIGYEYIKLSGYSMEAFDYGLKLDKFKFKKLYFSTSSLTLDEIGKVITNLRTMAIDFEMMHCICVYPTTLDKSVLQDIQFYKNHFCLANVGYSDHSNPHEDNLLTTKLAIFSGISVLERHFTILEVDETRDGKVSITPTMLEELRRFSNLSKTQQYLELNKFNEQQEFNHKYYKGRFK
jgi:sialic acid synthase SpsE